MIKRLQLQETDKQIKDKTLSLSGLTALWLSAESAIRQSNKQRCILTKSDKIAA